MWARTEGQPGLPDLQVDGKVGLQTQVTDGDIGTGLVLQAGKLHVAVEDAYGGIGQSFFCLFMQKTQQQQQQQKPLPVRVGG